MEQILALFEGSSVRLLTMADAGIEGAAKEDGNTLLENAWKKALYAHERSNAWVMADDVGIFITALRNAPGVRSKRWAGENATTEEITAFTLKQLEGATDRSAIFETVVALVSPGGEQHFFSGKAHGYILEA